MTYKNRKVRDEASTGEDTQHIATEAQKKELAELFVQVTGTDIVTETQERDRESRAVVGTDENTVSGYVVEVAKNDGLEETLPGLDKNGNS